MFASNEPMLTKQEYLRRSEGIVAWGGALAEPQEHCKKRHLVRILLQII